MEIVKVKVRKDGIKYCIIPKKSVFVHNELVKITKMEEENGRG